MLQLLYKILNTFQNIMLEKHRMINFLNNFFYLFSYLHLFIYNIYIYIDSCNIMSILHSYFLLLYNCDFEEPKVRCKVTCSVLVYHRYQTCPLLVVDPRAVSHSNLLPQLPTGKRHTTFDLFQHSRMVQEMYTCIGDCVYMCVRLFFTFRMQRQNDEF